MADGCPPEAGPPAAGWFMVEGEMRCQVSVFRFQGRRRGIVLNRGEGAAAPSGVNSDGYRWRRGALTARTFVPRAFRWSGLPSSRWDQVRAFCAGVIVPQRVVGNAFHLADPWVLRCRQGRRRGIVLIRGEGAAAPSGVNSDGYRWRRGALTASGRGKVPRVPPCIRPPTLTRLHLPATPTRPEKVRTSRCVSPTTPPPEAGWFMVHGCPPEADPPPAGNHEPFPISHSRLFTGSRTRPGR
jgi:hypothetical protein